MDPRAILTVAQNLSINAGGAAFMRSSISRSYYALFLVVCELLQKLEKPRVGDKHAPVCNALQHTQDPDLVRIGRELSALSTLRQRADYKMENNSSVETRKSAE